MARKARPRRAAGTGQVNWDNAHNTYYANLPVGKDPVTGRMKYRRRDATVKGFTDAGRRDAEQKLQELKDELTAQADTEEAGDSETFTVWDCISEWLGWMGEQQKVSERTLNTKLRVLADTWIKPRIGDVPLVKADLAVLMDFLEGIAPSLGTSSITNVSGILRRSINHAMRNKRPTAFTGLIPNKAIELPRAGRQSRQRDCLNLEQVDTVLDACEGDPLLYAVMMTGIYTGLRPQEIRALHWEDIDFANRRLYVVRVLKTGTSRRGVPMSDDLVDALKALKATSTSDVVFTRDGGIPLTKDALAWRVEKVFRKAGLPHTDPYIMRHTFASICDHNKVRHQDIADMMGHANLATFYAVYRHLLYPEVNVAADQMNAIFSRRKKPAA